MIEGLNKVFRDPYKLAFSTLFLFIACWFYPVNSFISRILLIAVFLIFWSSPYIAGVRSLKFMLSHLLLTALLALSPLILIKKGDALKQHKLYLKNLKSFEGTAYYWGGENIIGIDCSGLPRKSMINAYFYTGSFKKALDLWWYDCSAKALKENYRSYTKPVRSFSSLRVVDYSLVKKGDMAISADGAHVIVYLAGNKWIQADPNQGKVLIEDANTTSSPWFDIEVEIVRWIL